MLDMDKFTLHSHEAVLMIIDIQQRLASVMERREQVVKNAGILVDTAQKLGIPTVVTEQYPKGLGKTVDELSGKLDTDYVFEKIAFSACTEEVMSTLERLGRKKIIVTGMETHVCVLQTVRELLSLGYMVFVAEDTVCSRTRENHIPVYPLCADGCCNNFCRNRVFRSVEAGRNPADKELSKLIK